MRHQILTYGREQVAWLVKVFVFLGLWGHIRYLADVYEIFDVQLELALHISEIPVSVFSGLQCT